jgi:hypothetical protein
MLGIAREKTNQFSNKVPVCSWNMQPHVFFKKILISRRSFHYKCVASSAGK